VKRARLVPLLLLAAGAAAPLLAASPSAPAEKTDYLELRARRDELLRLEKLLEQESRLASARAPYVVLDLGRRTMDFRIRGKTFKSYRFDTIRMESRSNDLTLSEVSRRLAEPVTLASKEGGNPELIPPDPDADPNLAADADEEEQASDAALLGVEAPTDYQVDFEEGVVFHVSAPHAEGLMDKAMQGLGKLASGLGSLFSGWLSEPADENTPWLELSLTASAETVRQMHHSLMPGERFLIVLPGAGGTAGADGVE